MSYYITEDKEKEPSIVIVRDFDDPFCPLELDKMFLGLLKDKARVNL